jgi:hypothetical protein
MNDQVIIHLQHFNLNFELFQCQVGYAGNGRQCGLDSDLDGHPDITIACTDWGCYGVI